MTKSFSLLLTLLAVFLTYLPVDPSQASQELGMDELLDLDVHDLSKIKISIASKRSEKIKEAPSIISVVTALEIERYGAKNLKDILQRVPSIQGIGSHFYSHLINMRGQLIGHNNSDILFLINGRPNRVSWNGGTPYRLLLGFPIDAIDRIEIIRGPGSVLYGTGAFTGVINIITKTADRLSKTDIGFTAGSYDSTGFHATTGAENNTGSIMAGLRQFNTDGWEFTVSDQNGVVDSVNMEEENSGVIITGNYGIASLNLLYTDVELNNIGGPLQWPASQQNVKHLQIDFGLPFSFNDNWILENHLTYNRFDFRFLSPGLVEQERESEDTLIETTLKGKISDNANILLGATYEDISGLMPRSITYSSYRYSLYVQGDYSPLVDHKFVAGFQTNKVEGLNADTSPRLGYIHQFNQKWGGKLLYGEAFRSAAGTEQLLPPGSGGVIGSDSLDPEKIKTFEAQLFYSTSGYYSAITLFQSEIFDVIDRIQVSPGVSQFVNLPGKIDSKGIELETKITISDTTHVTGSLTWQENENEEGEPQSSAPGIMMKLGLDHVFKRGMTIGVFDSYFDDPERPDSLTFPPTDINPDPGHYHLLTAQLVMNIAELSSSETAPDMTISIFADNLLDEDIYYPEINTNTINSIPIHSGRALYGTVEIKL